MITKKTSAACPVKGRDEMRRESKRVAIGWKVTTDINHQSRAKGRKRGTSNTDQGVLAVDPSSSHGIPRTFVRLSPKSIFVVGETSAVFPSGRTQGSVGRPERWTRRRLTLVRHCSVNPSPSKCPHCVSEGSVGTRPTERCVDAQAAAARSSLGAKPCSCLPAALAVREGAANTPLAHAFSRSHYVPFARPLTSVS